MPPERLPVIGVLGGGQLGRMFVEACNSVDQKVSILDTELAPARQIAPTGIHVTGSFTDRAAVEKLASSCDVVTVEIEHVDVNALDLVARKVPVHPAPSTIRTIQNKFEQKEHLKAHHIALGEYCDVPEASTASIEAIGDKFGWPLMLKSKTNAYDGRGNAPIKSRDDAAKALELLPDRPLYAEKWISFQAELAVMVVKTRDRVLPFPAVETIHEDSICKLVFAPARDIRSAVAQRAQELACKAVSTFGGKGVFGVEMFLLKDGETLLINEIAPRPHNSGHYTIEACSMSQYEAHRRAITDEPIPEHRLRLLEPAIMLNVLGGKGPQSHLALFEQARGVGDANVHRYGKGDARPGRKMGHITVTAGTMHEAENIIEPLVATADKIRTERSDISSGSLSFLRSKKPLPTVSIIVGSKSDLKTLKPGLDLLKKQFSTPFEVYIKSAHRTPEEMAQHARQAAERGIKVIIAAAGGAAHLPGMVAAQTSLPVIGLPVKGSQLDGLDSLLSIVQMPRGVPVATVGINNSINAVLLAARFVGASDPKVQAEVDRYQRNAHDEVLRDNEHLGSAEYEAFFEEMT